MSTLNLSGVVEESIVDGPGMRFVIFVQGCPHNCPGCHNPETHEFHIGKNATTESLYQSVCKNPLIKGVTFSGGEPFCQADALSDLGEALQKKGYDIMVYSGYTAQELFCMARRDEGVRRLLSCANYLVDGPFLAAEKDLTLKFRGSANQRIYDITCFPNSTKIFEVDYASF